MIKKRNRFVVLVLLVLLTTNIASAQKDVKLSLYTCGTGSELYSSFGHSAIRVISASDSIDMIYNFGIFDFSDPEFYSKFINGIMLYMLGTQRSDHFVIDYNEEHRWVNEQKINLPDSTRIALVDWLKWTRRPENRQYYYDFLRNNCSSKLRDIVMIMQYKNIKFSNLLLNKTHRDLIGECLRENKWANFGINILLSSLIDKKVTRFEEMFLPDYLSKHGEEATINGIPILEKPVLVNQIPITYPTWHFKFTDPIMIMLYLLIATIIYRKKWLRNLFFILAGVLGVFLIFMWFGTGQTYVKYNYNILWLNPLFLILVLFFTLKKQILTFWILAAIILCQIVVLIAWIFKIQGYDIAFIPLMALFLVYEIREMLHLKNRVFNKIK